MIPDIKWYMGQSLLPDHFEHLQNALSAKSFKIICSSGIPFYGITRLEVEESFLKMGIVRVTKLEMITVDGQVIQQGVNAECKDYDLSSSKENKVELYLNLSDKDILFNDDEKSFKCHGYTLSFSTKPDPTASYYYKLLCVEKNLSQNWSISGDYLPPTISTSISLCSNLREQAGAICEKIFTSYDRMNKDKDFLLKAVDYKPVMTCAYEIKFHLRNINANNHVHPYFLYKMLHDLYIRVCLFFNVMVEDIEPYDHINIYQCFDLLIGKIEALVSHENRAVKYVKFERDEGFLTARGLEDSILYAQNLYFVVQKRSEEQPFDIEATKLSSPSRYPTINKLALSGLKKNEIEKVPFRHYLSGNCLFYQLAMGKEWDYVIKDRALTFPDKEDYKDIKFYLYYY
ncbi:type VI secretion system baseplate subunit TssK [Lentisphaerota bacterium ZTH]|nr:type VI secretion system baseplate subunit TssK [Lentisphaerota bacterium]WET05683.1 type VI secretion system baseplate subunit TssK [Lentisphaerota bacterium ZTH]